MNFIKKYQQKIAILDIALFFRQLATLVSTGIPLAHSCQILEKSAEKTTLQELILFLKQEVEAGNTFSRSLEKKIDHFDNFTVALTRLGEHTGSLDILLKTIAHYYEKKIIFKRKLWQALFYPLITFSIAMLVTFIMLFFIVPQFAGLFQPMFGRLPWITRCIFALSLGLREHIESIALLLLLVSAGLFQQKSRLVRHLDWRLLLRLPFFSTLLQKILVARFTRYLAITLASGMPVTEGLKLAANASGKHFFEKCIAQLEADLASGIALHTTMQSASAIFPTLMVQMIKTGEESGMLQAMLEKTAEFYEADTDQALHQLGQLLEPLIMVVLGVVIGGLIISMYLPIFKLGAAI